MIVEVGNVLVTSDIFTEAFCCDLAVCHGRCCVEGDAGAPVTLDEIAQIEETLESISESLQTEAREVVRDQGVAYADIDGELVTNIVNGQECVFAVQEGGCERCVLEKAHEEGKTPYTKPISCALYPLREKHLKNGTIGLNYHRWDICFAAREKGRLLSLPLYKFLREALVRRFGEEWYEELELVGNEFLANYRTLKGALR